MVALIFLSSTERELVRRGGIEDPSYRPYPGGRFDRDDSETTDDATAVEPLDFEQSAPAKFWKRGTYAVSILVGTDSRGEQKILGVGIAETVSRRKFKHTRVIRVSNVLRSSTPLQTSSVLQEIPTRSRAVLATALRETVSRSLPPQTASDFRTALAALSGDLIDLIDALPARQYVAPRATESVARYDANMTALRIFDARHWKTQQPATPSSLSTFAASVDAATIGYENDYIQDDLDSFLDWDRIASFRGWVTFENGGRRLLIKNVNVSPTETKTGADLVYVTHDPDSVVLVQYKLLQSLKDNRLFMRPDPRLPGQVDRLLTYCPGTADRGPDEDEARVGGDFAFLKFIAGGDHWQIHNRALPNAWYMPVDAVRRMLPNPDTGPEGGKVYYVPERRTIDPEVFAKLVRDRWIGSQADTTGILFKILGRPESSRAPLTIAVEEPKDSAR